MRKDHLNPFWAYDPYPKCLFCSESIFDVVEAKIAIFQKFNFTIFQKYSICGLKIEISVYPKKLHYLSYLPYKYEGIWIKTREMRAKSHWGFFLSPHCRQHGIVVFTELDLINRFSSFSPEYAEFGPAKTKKCEKLCFIFSIVNLVLLSFRRFETVSPKKTFMSISCFSFCYSYFSLFTWDGLRSTKKKE